MKPEEITAKEKHDSKEVSQEFERTIKSYLDNLSEQDDSFSYHYSKEDRNIDDCCKFIISKVKEMAKSNGSIGLADDDVYNLAKLYYTSDNVSEIKHIQCKVVVNHAVALTPEEKELARKKAFDELVEENKKRMSNTPKKVKKEEASPQMSLFE